MIIAKTHAIKINVCANCPRARGDTFNFLSLGLRQVRGPQLLKSDRPADMEPHSGILTTSFHLIMSVYNAALLHRIRKIVRENQAVFDPRGEIPEYAGQFKYLTHINQWIQLAFFSGEFLLDLLPNSGLKHMIQSCLSFAFATVIFPLAWYVTTTFWAVYYYDMNLIYKEISRIINHLSHTAIVLWVVLEVLLRNHRFPNLSTAVVPIFTCCLLYISWLEWIHAQTRFWVYPILNTLPRSGFYFVLFYGCSIFLCFVLYLVGRTVSNLFWGDP